MSAYIGAMASWYSTLLDGVDYAYRAERLYSLATGMRGGVRPELVLDLACGDGSLAVRLADLGMDVIAVDGCDELLFAAQQKLEGRPVLLLLQDMQELDLYGTVQSAFCTQDSINHLSPSELDTVLGRLRLFVEPRGVFLFDVNTPYKHREILGSNTFVYDRDGLFCVWQNEYDEQKRCVNMEIDVFSEAEDGTYQRSYESITEWDYDIMDIAMLLAKNGFRLDYVFSDYSHNSPAYNDERWLVAATRI